MIISWNQEDSGLPVQSKMGDKGWIHGSEVGIHWRREGAEVWGCWTHLVTEDHRAYNARGGIHKSGGSGVGSYWTHSSEVCRTLGGRSWRRKKQQEESWLLGRVWAHSKYWMGNKTSHRCWAHSFVAGSWLVHCRSLGNCPWSRTGLGSFWASREHLHGSHCWSRVQWKRWEEYDRDF